MSDILPNFAIYRITQEELARQQGYRYSQASIRDEANAVRTHKKVAMLQFVEGLPVGRSRSR